MGWFKRKKEISLKGDAVAKRTAVRILAFQRKVADGLNARTKKVDPTLLKALLLVAGLLFGSYCLWLIAIGLC